MRSRAFPLLEMFWSTNQNKLLSNHCANLKSHEASLLIMKFRDDSRAYGNIKRNQTRSYEPFLLLAWINSLQEKRNGSSISVSMDLMPIKRRDLQSNYLLSMLNHFTLKYLMADLDGQEITVQRTLWRHQSNIFTGWGKRFTKKYSLARISVAVKPSSTSDRGVEGRGYYVEGRFSISFFMFFFFFCAF